MIYTMIYTILDKITQFFCKHEKNLQSSQEVLWYKYWSSTMTYSWEWNIENKIHCNKCGKKWIKYSKNNL